MYSLSRSCRSDILRIHDIVYWLFFNIYIFHSDVPGIASCGYMTKMLMIMVAIALRWKTTKDESSRIPKSVIKMKRSEVTSY